VWHRLIVYRDRKGVKSEALGLFRSDEAYRRSLRGDRLRRSPLATVEDDEPEQAVASGAGGGVLATVWRPSRWVTSYIQHFAAGVVIAAVALKIAAHPLPTEEPTPARHSAPQD
jgi:hypothetical protein